MFGALREGSGTMLTECNPVLSRLRKAAARSRLLAAIALELWRSQGENGTLLSGGLVRHVGLDAFGEGRELWDSTWFRSDLWRGDRRSGLRQTG